LRIRTQLARRRLFLRQEPTVCNLPQATADSQVATHWSLELIADRLQLRRQLQPRQQRRLRLLHQRLPRVQLQAQLKLLHQRLPRVQLQAQLKLLHQRLPRVQLQAQLKLLRQRLPRVQPQAQLKLLRQRLPRVQPQLRPRRRPRRPDTANYMEKFASTVTDATSPNANRSCVEKNANFKKRIDNDITDYHSLVS
jgi:hypothetical protein